MLEYDIVPRSLEGVRVLDSAGEDPDPFLTLSWPCPGPVLALSWPCPGPVLTLSWPCPDPVLALSWPCPFELRADLAFRTDPLIGICLGAPYLGAPLIWSLYYMPLFDLIRLIWVLEGLLGRALGAQLHPLGGTTLISCTIKYHYY